MFGIWAVVPMRAGSPAPLTLLSNSDSRSSLHSGRSQPKKMQEDPTHNHELKEKEKEKEKEKKKKNQMKTRNEEGAVLHLCFCLRSFPAQNHLLKEKQRKS